MHIIYRGGCLYVYKYLYLYCISRKKKLSRVTNGVSGDDKTRDSFRIPPILDYLCRIRKSLWPACSLMAHGLCRYSALWVSLAPRHAEFRPPGFRTSRTDQRPMRNRESIHFIRRVCCWGSSISIALHYNYNTQSDYLHRSSFFFRAISGSQSSHTYMMPHAKAASAAAVWPEPDPEPLVVWTCGDRINRGSES
jgi:hypothetical protein